MKNNLKFKKIKSQTILMTDSASNQFSIRKYNNYDLKIATEKALIELGEQIAYEKEEKKKRKLSYEYLNSVIEELKNFNHIKFINKLNNIDNKKQMLEEVYNVIGCISAFNELNNYNLNIIKILNKKIKSLEVENEDLNEMGVQFMDELEETEKKLKTLTKSLKEFDIEFKNYKNLADQRISNKNAYIKWMFIVNIFTIVLLAICWFN